MGNTEMSRRNKRGANFQVSLEMGKKARRAVVAFRHPSSEEPLADDDWWGIVETMEAMDSIRHHLAQQKCHVDNTVRADPCRTCFPCRARLDAARIGAWLRRMRRVTYSHPACASEEGSDRKARPVGEKRAPGDDLRTKRTG